MRITVNGEQMEIPEGSTVQDLLEHLQITGQRIAVAVNGQVVPSGTHDRHVLKEGDDVELVHAVGGG